MKYRISRIETGDLPEFAMLEMATLYILFSLKVLQRENPRSLPATTNGREKGGIEISNKITWISSETQDKFTQFCGTV
jgi:hypothetical protein